MMDITKPNSFEPSAVGAKIRWRVCCSALLIFALLQLMVGWQRGKGQNPICNAAVEYPPWVESVNVFISSAFIVTALNQVVRINVSTFNTREDFDTLLNFYASFCVNIIAGSATLLTYIFDWGGTCVSVDSVPMSASLFPEWIISVPLMAYLVESTNDEFLVAWKARIPVIGHSLTILFGGLAQVARNRVQLYACLTVSACCSVVGFYAWFQAELECEHLYKRLERTSRLRRQWQRHLSIFERKRSLAAVIAFMFPVFPAIYFLRMFGWIDNDVTFVSFLVASFVTKSVFSALCMDSHLEVSHPMANTLAAEEHANRARRSFLRYIFHEVRGALNVITIGADLLDSNDDGASSSDTETVKMIRDASMSMVETLNNAQMLQRIEEGTLDVYNAAFFVQDALDRIVLSLIPAAEAAEVRLLMEAAEEVPAVLVGDVFKIRSVLTHLMANAIRFSHKGGEVSLTASVEPAPRQEPTAAEHSDAVTLRLTVVDHGTGFAEPVHLTASDYTAAGDVFAPYTAGLRFGNEEKPASRKGTGLGLATCRELVHLLGGDITCVSAPGRGSTFTLLLPLQRASVDDAATAVSPGGAQEAEPMEETDPQGSGDGVSVDFDTPPLADEVPQQGASDNAAVVAPTCPSAAAASHVDAPRGIPAPIHIDTYMPPPPLVVTASTTFFQPTRSPTARSPAHNSITARSPAHISTAVRNPAAEGAAGSPREKAKVSDDDPAASFAQLKILIVDDVAMIRKMLGRLLERQGVQAAGMAFAEDGALAVQAVAQQAHIDHYNIVFLDNNMPNMTGIECAKALRALGYSQMIVGITGNSLDEELAQFVRAGADLVLTKPLVLDTMQQLLVYLTTHSTQSRVGMKLKLRNDTFQLLPESEYFQLG